MTPLIWAVNFHLLGAYILAREHDVFIEWHAIAFPSFDALPARSPSMPFGKGSKA